MNINVEIAKSIVIAYLEKGDTTEGIYEIFQIKFGNRDVLLEHIKALKNIFSDAIEELEKDE